VGAFYKGVKRNSFNMGVNLIRLATERAIIGVSSDNGRNR